MGIVIDVNGLVNTFTGEGSSVTKANWKVANYIRELMGWEEFPWQEPEGEGGLDTSMSYGTYNLLLKVALVADMSNPLYNKEEEVTTISHCKSQLFPQLLDRNIYWNIYVPFDLPEPIVHGEFGYTFSIGSVVRYGQQLENLTPYIREDFLKQVFGKTDNVDYYMELLTAKLNLLKEGVADSLRLNLPLQIRW